MNSISVVIPFYHAEEFFEETYQSIKNQTLQPSEIIVVIDGCGEKAEKFLTKYSDLNVISLPKNVGPAEARNIGVKAATSQWIAFIDADDKWEHNKLEQQMNFLAKHPEFSACHTGIIAFNKDVTISTFNDKPFELNVNHLLESSQVVPTSFIVLKDAFHAVGGFDLNLKCSEDHDFTLSLVLQEYKIGFLNKPLSYLRREDHGNISSNGRKIIVGHIQLLKKHWRTFKKHSGSRSYFLYKTFMSSGGKSQGVEKKCYYLIAHAIAFVFNIKK